LGPEDASDLIMSLLGSALCAAGFQNTNASALVVATAPRIARLVLLIDNILRS